MTNHFLQPSRKIESKGAILTCQDASGFIEDLRSNLGEMALSNSLNATCNPSWIREVNVSQNKHPIPSLFFTSSSPPFAVYLLRGIQDVTGRAAFHAMTSESGLLCGCFSYQRLGRWSRNDLVMLWLSSQKETETEATTGKRFSREKRRKIPSCQHH